MKHLVAR